MSVLIKYPRIEKAIQFISMIKIIQKTSGTGAQKEKETRQAISTLHHQSEEERTSEFAAKINFPYIDINLIPISNDSLRTLKEEDSRRYNLAVIQKEGRKITAISADPTQEHTKNFIKKISDENEWEVKLFVASPFNMEKIWERYKKIVFVDILAQLNIQLTSQDLAKFDQELKDLISLKEKIKNLPTTQVLNVIMGGAYKLGASDIHLEPEEQELRLRYRIDGVLHDIAFLPIASFRSIVSRIKMMAEMKINLSDIAQDGTFEIKLDEKKVAVRVSIIPGNFGETIVMRLLDPDSIKVEVELLGMRGLAYEEIQKQINAPNGMILTTGPTGSGKTTTLYAIINKLNNPEKKIITIEDPIEYEVRGISQTQIEKSRGYTFASGLRAIVRQDPDVILVGEIRDEETADIAINSALTGHLVLSTLHTNSAAGTIPRLIEMGTKPSLIAPAVNAIIGQRLVRKLCKCKESYAPANESIESLKKILSIISPKSRLSIPRNIDQLFRPKGCPECNNLGYKGRVGIFEVLTLNEEIEKMILELASESDLIVAALESGMITMLQDGILKAIEGITSIDEVKRVTGEGDFLEGIYEKLMSQTLSRGITIEKDLFQKTDKAIKNMEQFQDFLRQSKTNELSHIFFTAAALLKAGDIHIEPGSENVKIRFRIDGILQTVAEIPLNDYPTFLGEIKILSGVKTEMREGTVDSRFSIKFSEDIKDIKERSIDVRVSIILGGYGETVVMRLLNKSAVDLDIKKLGIRKENLEKILEQTKKPNGIILNTGPTGSGKTTTLYSLLNILNKPEVKIITVEDPIEYQIEGVLQTPVNNKEGYTFATALRSLLRQNPDILMIGEIRDDETAQIAAQSALTGHLVLSTIHTNNAAGAVQRMLNMGVSPTDIASAVNAFIAQRLVRKLCECKIKSKPTQEEKLKIERVLKTISPKSGVKVPTLSAICKPSGCPKCNGLGYKGRTTLSEVFVIDREIEDLINHGAITSELNEKAVQNGMITMEQDGILKVLEGETTLEEVERMTDL